VSKVEIIKNLFDENEKLLFEKVISPNTKRERIYVVTDKRVYKKKQDVPRKNYFGAPKKYLEVKNDILVISRQGIIHVKLAGAQTLMSKIMERMEKAKEQRDIFQTTEEKAPEVKRFQVSEDTKEKYQKAKKKFKDVQNRRKIMIYLRDAQRRPYMILDKLNAKEAEELANLLTSTDTMSDELAEWVPFQTSEEQSEHFNEEEFVKTTVISRRPSQQPPIYENTSEQQYIEPNPHAQFNTIPSQDTHQEEYLTPSFDTDFSTSNSVQFLEISDENIFHRNTCSYCGNLLSTYQEKTYSCSGCNTYYHESCLNNLIRTEGICINCNKIILY